MVRCIAFFLALYAGSATGVTFEQVQRDVFEFSCAGGGCHGGGVFPTLRADRSYSAIVNVKSRQNRDLFLIEPFNPTDSYLLRKVENRDIFGDLMPQSGPIPQTRQKLLRDWIAGGALEFGEPAATEAAATIALQISHRAACKSAAAGGCHVDGLGLVDVF